MTMIDRMRCYRLSSRMKQTILSVVIWGVIAHLYMYMNRIVNHDSVFLLQHNSGATIASGRWFLELLVQIANRFNNNYITPWGIGAVTIFVYAASACMLVKAFDIKSKPLCCMMGALLVTYPSVTSNNLYLYTAHYYAYAFALACGSVLLLTLWSKPVAVLGSGLMIALSLGIYQAYIPFVLSMYVLLILLKCLSAEAATADIIRTGLRFLAALGSGLVLYFAMNQVFLHLADTAMNTYMGLDQMGKIELSSIPTIIRDCYSSFFGLFLHPYHGVNHKPWLRIMMLLCLLFAIAVIVYLIWKNRICAVHIAFICAAIVLFPIAVGGIYIMVRTADAICTMTVFSTIFVFFLPICIADRLFRTLSVNRAFVAQSFLCLALGLVCIYYSSLANETYLALEYANQNINAYYTELATQIKSQEHFSTDMKVAWIGVNWDESIPRINCDYIIRGAYPAEYLINSYTREYFMTMHCGYSCTFVEDTQALEEDDRVKAMPAYPSAGSICIIDDVIVVKFS